jgi:hypothetical protein
MALCPAGDEVIKSVGFIQSDGSCANANKKSVSASASAEASPSGASSSTTFSESWSEREYGALFDWQVC